jgi:2,4-dienoyl-CoA reductase-like NADH-dependent reductase (Old Yellow Enzyme family)
MKTLFDQTTVNGMTLENRLARSATWEGMCDAEGKPGPKLIALYRELARGKVGLIITGYTFVSPEGKQLPGKMGIHSEDFADIMKEMTREDISRVITAFGSGARRAKDWGFDAVQLHGAHGYLINQFLSPLTNQRKDEYGGSIENRCRFLLEAYQAVRSAVGPDFPIMIKLNGSDNLAGGLTIEDAVFAAKALDKEGIDCIEVSGGTPASGNQSPARMKINSPEKEAYNLSLAEQFRAAVKCPIMVVGGFRSFEIAEKTIQESADYISMARPFIREPGLAKRWQEGDRSPARCISCNSCFMPGIKEGGIYCVAEKKEQEKKQKNRK